ncbi:MAG: hypothetical protein ABJJ14_16410, partial [Cyclobacteriaceae bacterium]
LTLADLQDTTYAEWYNKNYEAFALTEKNSKWAKQLKSSQVDIYMGTWCGDSREWVPQFVKLWETLGLDLDDLNFIALYDGQEQYKQGPNGEEEGKNIHRVPTFVFKQNGDEYARIVESPVNDLETDVAQIALGYPSVPKYRAASYMMDLLESKSKEDLEENIKTYFFEAYHRVSKMGELNTLGYVYLRSGRIDEALTVFRYNTYYFKHNPNVYDSYAEALAAKGLDDLAIANYQKVLQIDPDNENALEQIELLEAKNSQLQSSEG